MTNTPAPDDDGYALDLSGPVQHVATALSNANADGLAPADLAAGYSHFAGDLARVRKHEHLDSDAEAVTWLIDRAVTELTRNGFRGKIQLTVDELTGRVALAPGVTADDLRWHGNPVYTPVDIHKVLGDPFNPMSGRYAGNVRKNTGKDDTRELEASMRAAGWLPGSPAVKDARTGVTITGHRRLKVAAKLRDEGIDIPDNILYVNFELDGEGDIADMHRMNVALLSNYGFKRLTPEERAETALWLKEGRGMTQQQIAAATGVSQQTVSRDLRLALTQLGNDLEELIAGAVAAIERGLTQSQFGVERGLKNNSMMLAKAWAVATDRIAAGRQPSAPQLDPETMEALRLAGEKLASDKPIDPDTQQPYDASQCEHALGTCPEECGCHCAYCIDRHQSVPEPGPQRQGLEDVEDDRDDRGLPPQPEPLPQPEPRHAVNPPQDLPPAPLTPPYDDPALTEAWTWSDAAGAWVLQRDQEGRFWVTCQLPRDTPPAFPAPLFGVFVIEAAE